MFFSCKIDHLISNSDPAAGLQVFFALLVAHVLCDYPLQGEFLALNKNRHYRSPKSGKPNIWIHCLTSHALIHAGAVWAVTGSALLGILELFLHWIIDFLRGEGIINIHIDQLLHVLCKIAYVVVMAVWL